MANPLVTIVLGTRPEAVSAGTARLIGTDAADILAEASTLLTDAAAYEAMARAHNPFGDGTASAQIVAAAAAWLSSRAAS